MRRFFGPLEIAIALKNPQPPRPGHYVFRLHFPRSPDDNRIVPSTSFYQAPQPVAPFRPGALVIATLSNPREKFWGAILHLSPTGLSLRGVDLSSFDDFTAQIRDGEPFAAGVMFFPMHRVERLELDLPEGSIPSLAQRFAQKTGQDPAPILVSEFLPATSEHPPAHGTPSAKKFAAHPADNQESKPEGNSPEDIAARNSAAGHPPGDKSR